MVRRADETIFFHPINQPRRAVVPNAQLTLNPTCRGLLAFEYNLARLAILRIFFAVIAAHAAKVETAIFGLFGHRLDIFGLPLAAPLSLELRVVYYDMFGGGFNVTYDAGSAGGGCRTADQVAVGNSGGWRTATLPLLAEAGAFGRGCGAGGGADIALTSASGDTILSTMEIYKV